MEYATRVTLNYGLQLTLVNPYWFISCNKCTTWDVRNMENSGGGGKGGYMGIPCTFHSFFPVNLKLLKLNCLFIFNLHGHILDLSGLVFLSCSPDIHPTRNCILLRSGAQTPCPSNLLTPLCDACVLLPCGAHFTCYSICNGCIPTRCGSSDLQWGNRWDPLCSPVLPCPSRSRGLISSFS